MSHRTDALGVHSVFKTSGCAAFGVKTGHRPAATCSLSVRFYLFTYSVNQRGVCYEWICEDNFAFKRCDYNVFFVNCRKTSVTPLTLRPQRANQVRSFSHICSFNFKLKVWILRQLLVIFSPSEPNGVFFVSLLETLWGPRQTLW